MSDQKLNEAYYRREREEVEKWLLAEPTTKPEQKPGESPKPQKAQEEPGLLSRIGAAAKKVSSTGQLKGIADVLYPPQPPAEGRTDLPTPVGQTPTVIETLGQAAGEVVGAVGKRFTESKEQLQKGITGQSEPAFESETLGTLRDVGLGALNTFMPFGAAAEHVGRELVDYDARVNGSLTDEVLKAKLRQAKLHAPGEAAVFEHLLSLPYDQRLEAAKAGAGLVAEVVSGLVPGYTGVAKAAGMLGKGAGAGRGAARAAVGEAAEGTARQATEIVPPGAATAPAEAGPVVGSTTITPEEFVKQIGIPGAETLLEKGKRALQSPEVQEWAAKVWDEIRGERGAIGQAPKHAPVQAAPEFTRLLSEGEYAVLSAEKGTMDPATRAARTEELRATLEERGYQPLATAGKYGGEPEASFVVPGLKEDEAFEISNALAAKYGDELQESVLTTRGLVYNADRSVNPATGKAALVEDAEDFFSATTLPSGEVVKFAVPIDFDTKIAAAKPGATAAMQAAEGGGRMLPDVGPVSTEGGAAPLTEGVNAAAMAPKGVADTAEAAMPGLAMTREQGREALEQTRRNEAMLEDLGKMRAMLQGMTGQESPSFLDTLRNILRDETGAIGAKLPETKRALKLAVKGEGGANWYVGVPEELQTHFGDDWKLVSDLIAVTSPNTRVEMNVKAAIEAYAAWKQGKLPKDIGADVPTTSAFAKRAVQGLLEGQPLEGVLKSTGKVYNFAKALQGDRNAVVIDRWLWGIFYPEEAAKAAERAGKGTYSGTDARYKLVEDWMRTQAAKMGMPPADLQAAIWVGAKIDAGDLGGIKPLREYIAEAMKTDKIEQEAFDFFENVGKTMNEEGRINLGTTFLLARAAIGATLGGLTGDDPESMARNALIGLGVGSIASGKTARAIAQAFSGDKLRGAVDDLTAVLKSQEGTLRPGARFGDFAKKPTPPAPAGALPVDPAKSMMADINSKLLYAKKLHRVYDAGGDPQVAAALRSNRFRTIEDIMRVDPRAVKPADAAATMQDMVGIRDFVLEDLLESFARAKMSGDPGMAREARSKYAFAGRLSQHVTDTEAALGKGVARGGSPTGAINMDAFSKDLARIEAAVAGTMEDGQLVEMVTRMGDRAAAAKIAETGSRYPQALWNIYYGLNLLSSPLTHVKNILGSGTGLGLAIADRALGELVAIPYHVVGKGAGHVQFGETYDLVRGAWEMVGDSFRAGKKGALQFGGDTFRTGESAFGDITKAGERIRMLAAKQVEDAELGGPRALAKIVDLMSTLAQKNLKFMDGTDEFFKVLSFNGELKAQARRLAASEGFSGKDLARRIDHYIDRPTTEMLENAHAYAHENTFTKAFDPEAGGWRHLGGTGAAAQAFAQTPLMRLAMSPFFRTPTRLAEFSLTHTPGLNLLAVQTASDFAAGGAKRDLAISKALVGMGVVGLTFWGASHGYITGGWPKDQTLREAYKRDGWRPYSFYNPWTGKYHSYAGIEPISTMLAGAANFAQYAPHLTDYQADTIIKAMVLSYKDGIFNNPFLQGASDANDVIESMNRGDNAEKMIEWMGKRAAALVPFGSAGRSVARAMSDVERETRTVSDAPPELREMEIVLNQFRQMVPGWSDTRPAKINIITGEPIPTENGWLGLINPFQISTFKNDRVLNELVALEGAGLPREVPRVLGGNMPRDNVIVKESDIKEGVLLTDDERTEFARLLTHTKNDDGETLHQALATLMDSEEYKDATAVGGRDSLRADLVKSIFREFFITADEKFKENHPEVANVIERRQLERDLQRLPSSMEDTKDPIRQLLEQTQAGR